MKRKPSGFVYTNIGLESGQHRRLKHAAVEEGRDMASLVREAIDLLLDEKRKAGVIPYKDDFVLFKLGRTWLAKEERPFKPKDWSPTDRDMYGPDEDARRK